MGSSPRQVPVINFSDLDPEIPGGERWEASRAEVMAALESFRCFEALYDGVSPELRQSLFGDGMRDVFGLPLAMKKQIKSDVPYQGYIGQIPNMEYESLIVDDADTEDGVRRFAGTMWPDGNPRFCNTVRSFAEQLSKLDRMVRRMIMESLGVEEDHDSHIRSVSYKLRVSKNKVFDDNATVLPDHLDANLLTIDCQHHIEGLEVQTDDGDWITVHPLPNSFTILIGESMEAWTNGRLLPTHHRVRMSGKELRYSAIFFTFPENGKDVVAPKELINDKHPVLFKPFNTADWFNFRFSDEGSKAKHALKAFCGVEAATSSAASQV